MSSAIDAVIAGLKRGGVERVYNFPGYHSHEIAEGIGMEHISLNERVAYAEAFGASIAGKRSVVAFKNVGLNIAADAFLHSIIAGVNAGLVVIITDDTYVDGSQESQDSRHYFDFYGGLWFDPASPQEAYDVTSRAFELSERFDIPVVVRLTGQYFDTTGSYADDLGAKKSDSEYGSLPIPERHVVHPYYFRSQEKRLQEKQVAINNYVNELAINSPANHRDGVIVFGAADFDQADVDVLHVNTLPLPDRVIRQFIDGHDHITVYEDGDPYVHEKISQYSNQMKIKSGSHPERGVRTDFVKWPHYSEIFTVINSVLDQQRIAGDITQFTVETTDTIGVALSLGVAVGTAIGMADAAGSAYAIAGDTSFLHEGKGIVEEAKIRKVKLGIIIIDNGMSWCTGGQQPVDDISSILQTCPSWTADLRGGGVAGLESALRKMKDVEGVSIVRILVPDMKLVTRS